MTGAGTVRLRNEAAAVTLGLCVIALGGVIDVTTGRDLSLSIVYVAGVAFMAGVGSFRIALLGAFGAGAAVLTDGLVNSVGTGVAFSNAVTALALLVATGRPAAQGAHP